MLVIAAVAASTFGLAMSAGVAQAASPTASSAKPSRVRAVDPMAAVATAALTELREYIRSGASSTLAAYEGERAEIADVVAIRLVLDPAQINAAWSAADLDHQVALMAAFTQLGVPYHTNMSKAGVGFDCSGLTTYAWGIAGQTLTRQSAAQIRKAAPRTAATAMAGDLVYYPGHVMLYLGVANAIVHAPYTGRGVEVDMIAHHRSVRYGDPDA
ncbi:MAG TPA: NlpC/P60 family protein [Ilumatobacteraceae bacterium]